MELLSRNLASWARELLSVTPVLVIEGARQAGKTTLASVLSGEDAVYVTMDDEVSREFARDDPAGFLNSAGSGQLVIDEVQRCPELILPLKTEVDRDRRPGKFILTGSANLLRIPSAEDSLAGRAITIRLHPFTQGELVGAFDDWVSKVLAGELNGHAGVDRGSLVECIVKGGYAPVQKATDRVRSSWLLEYAKRLVERDSADLGRAQLPVLHKLLRLLAAAPGAEVVPERLADALGVTRSTVNRYLEILDGLFLTCRLPSWSRNLTSRQVSREKRYVSDTGLACALAGLSVKQLQSPRGSDHLGSLLENFVVNELVRQSGWSQHNFDLFHYRDRNGAEVDIVIDTPDGVIGVEVKAASAPRASHFKHLALMRDRLGDEFVAGVVLNLGPSQQAGERLYSLPVSSLWDWR